jgi:hypothetical protein
LEVSLKSCTKAIEAWKNGGEEPLIQTMKGDGRPLFEIFQELKKIIDGQ